MRSLLLAEELFLLTHDDDSGKGAGTIALDNGYAGALLLELAAEELVGIDGQHITPTAKAGESTHPLLAATLEELLRSEKPRKPKHWVSKLPGALKPLSRRIGESLVERGVLGEEGSKVLGLFPTTKWPELDPAPEQALRDRLRAVLVQGADPDLRTALLISLLSPLDLIGGVVDKADRKEAKRRAKAIAESDLGGGATSAAVKQSVEAIHAAILVAILVPVIVSGS